MVKIVFIFAVAASTSITNNKMDDIYLIDNNDATQDHLLYFAKWFSTGRKHSRVIKTFHDTL